MANTKQGYQSVLRRSLISGSIASIASAVSLSLLGQKELKRSAAPINGPSQWLWGRQAAYANRFTFRHTVIGYCIHHAASIFWAIWYERFRHNAPTANVIDAAITPAVFTTATAYTVDFYLIPKRFAPGFENRLSKKSLLAVYGIFALGLATPALLARLQKLR